MPRSRPIVSGAAQGAWQQALREAERLLRQQANMGMRGQGHVSQEAIWNRALQMGARPPAGARPPGRSTVVPGQRAAQAAALGPGVPPALQDLITQFQTASDDANAANEKRYQDILAGYQDLIGNVTGRFEGREKLFAETIAGFGTNQAADINRRFDQLGSAQQSDLINRGLTGTTIKPAVESANEEARARALAALQEQITGMKLSGQSQLSGDTANAIAALTQNMFGFQDRRTDQGPDFGQLAQLAQLFGAGNAGQGFNVPVPGAGANLPTGQVGISAPLAAPGGIQFGNMGQQMVGQALGNQFNNQIAPFLLQQQLAAQQAQPGPVRPQPQLDFFGRPMTPPKIHKLNQALGAPVGTPTWRYRNAYVNVHGRNPWAGSTYMEKRR
jgi:hypothetical protein